VGQRLNIVSFTEQMTQSLFQTLLKLLQYIFLRRLFSCGVGLVSVRCFVVLIFNGIKCPFVAKKKKTSAI
jgi:hypothetical protein